jgi:GNAT superfamily N-acetyltransferase
MTIELSFKPLKRNLWTDLEELFGPRGACAGCWCMYWKLRGKAFDEARDNETRQMHKSIVDSGVETGLLAYMQGEIVGWIAVEPREAYSRLAHSRTLKTVDEESVWSVTCFFVAKDYRRQGISVELLLAAVEHVRSKGGSIVEGYPTETANSMPAPLVYTGIASAFKQAGFQEVARRSSTRPIYRYYIE